VHVDGELIRPKKPKQKNEPAEAPKKKGRRRRRPTNS
jgi:hypothetical protein